MSKILAQWPADMSERDVYKITRGNARKMQEIAGSVITPEQFALYEDIDVKTGETKRVLTIIADGEKFGTISPTFIREFMDAAEQFGGDVGTIKVLTGESKNGREFVTCELV